MADRSLNEWLEYIEKKHPSEIDLGLERVNCVWSRIKSKFGISKIANFQISVAGTNGKGSTVRCLEQILKFHGYKVGSFYSPHIFKFNERIKLDGISVSDQAIIESFKIIEAFRHEVSLTYFEFNTLCALLIFSKSELDFVLLEVGLGGRLDAVNIIDSDIAILTSIGLDHQQWLGNTRYEIGCEKLGIAREGKNLLIGETDCPKDLDNFIDGLGTNTYRINKDFTLSSGASNIDELCITQNNQIEKFGKLAATSVLNINKALAIQALTIAGIKIQREKTIELLDQLVIEGRQQKVKYKGVNVILDVAHNPQAAERLAENLHANGKIYAVASVLDDKDWNAIVDKLASVFDAWFIGQINDNKRAANAYQLLEMISMRNLEGKVFESIEMAFQKAYNSAHSIDLIVVFGSFSCVASIMNLIEVQEF